MTDSTGTPSTPAGWYADPAGSDRLRWWDGTRWTDHLTDAPAAGASAGASAAEPASGAGERPAESATAPAASHVPPVASPPAYAQQPYSQQPYAQQPYSPAGYRAPTPPPKVPASTSPWTWAIWVLAALPVISIVISLSVDYRSVMDPSPRGLSPEAAVTSALVNFVQFLLWGATVVLAFLDWRDLTRRGIVKPFHWAWAFIPVSGGVYLIGRSIIARRRIEGAPASALTPIWVWVGLNALGAVIAIAKGVEVFLDVMQRYGTSGY
ncbi:hypothetical protein BFL36_11740 [Clavibacter michiganensis]|uniref:DUF2510 domain-containing protein n=1 Tax=Clavibacter michiganensis TaxID=28447 RepID=A0A251Y8E1_9MICO|nr:DUF2510 domain-containing protein [Clavibacter michiganensis]OUE20328.1 hypothetical protein BFL36_11740 [Clavibacter michiganensis]